jgi:hypothetical protein
MGTEYTLVGDDSIANHLQQPLMFFMDYKVYMIWAQSNLGMCWIFLGELEISGLVAQCLVLGFRFRFRFRY